MTGLFAALLDSLAAFAALDMAGIAAGKVVPMIALMLAA